MRQPNAVRRPARKGSALAESALVIIPLVSIVAAVLDFGQLLFVHQSIVEASRKAACYGIVTASDEAAIRNIVIRDGPASPSNAQRRFNLDAYMAAVSRRNAGASSGRIEVKLSNYPFQVNTPFIAARLRGMPITAKLPYEVS